MQKPKITYIIDNLRVGGAQVHIAQLIERLQKKNVFQIELISLGDVSEVIRNRIPESIPNFTFEMESTRQLCFYRSFLGLVKHLKYSKPDIVQTFLNTANVFGTAAAFLSGSRRIITSRRDMGQFRSPLIAFIEGIISRTMASRVYCVCSAVASKTKAKENIRGDKLRVLYNGVDTLQFKQKSTYGKSEIIKFGMLAAMDRVEKGHRDFLKAASLLMDKCAGSFYFEIAGDGVLRSSLENIARDLGIYEHVRFLGEINDIPSFLEGIDILVIPSFSEGISNALLEAMAAGVAVIATAVDGNLETVTDGETGKLVYAQNPHSIMEAMLSYIKNRAIIETHGKNARIRAKDCFSVETMITEYCREYSELLNE